MIITFDPIIHDKVWGTEEWLLTEENVPNNIPKSSWEMIKAWSWGSKNPDRDKFPLALKVIDAKENLSLQVHPDKNEAWWILAVRDIGGTIYTAGPNQEAKAGHSLVIQANTLHGLGVGIKVFEMADKLGITYRLHDYGRDREIQPELAQKCLKFQSFPPKLCDESIVHPTGKWSTAIPYVIAMPLKLRKDLIGYEHFSPHKGEDISGRILLPLPEKSVSLEEYKSYIMSVFYVPNGETFRYHYVVGGQVECEGQSFEKGQGFLVTASHRKGYMLNGKAEVLTVSFL